jgi:hypothetical protein
MYHCIQREKLEFIAVAHGLANQGRHVNRGWREHEAL